MEVVIFGIKMVINPEAFTIPIGNGWTVYWYGIIIASGFALAMIYGYVSAKRFNLEVDRMLDVVLVATPCAILGARTYYVIFDGKPLGGIKDFFGLDGSGFSGLAIYGGIIGAVVAAFIMCHIRKVKFLDMLDLASVAFLIGQGIGRWGNFMNQEAFGIPTGSSFWGMTSDNVVRDFLVNGYDPTALAHPCFLYESVWCLLGAVILHLLSKKRYYSGQTALMYCAWYGFGRTFIELLRTDSLMIGRLRISFIISFLICVSAVIFLATMRRKRIRIEAENNYEKMFKDELAPAEGINDENFVETEAPDFNFDDNEVISDAESN